MRVVTLLLLAAAIVGLQAKIDETFGDYRVTEEILYVERGDVLKNLTLGFENLAADIYWLRTVQYFGGRRREVTNKNYDLLEPLLLITTDLDPAFKIAYTYGATFLAEPFPMGAGLPLKGIDIIEKGIANHPDYWRFHLDKGFIYFWHLKDYEKAAETFLEGSKLPGAPYWMVSTASRTLARGGDRETARGLWRILHDSAETEQQRENARAHLLQLDVLDQLDELRKILERYEAASRRVPRAAGRSVVAAGMLRGIPLDPAGNPYILDPVARDVDVSVESGFGVLPTQ